MIVEWLRFWINPSDRARFLQQDALIWTPALAAQAGFNRKEYWQPADPEELIIVVHWQSYAQWKAIAPEFLAATESRFTQAVGTGYKLLDVQEFPVIEWS